MRVRVSLLLLLPILPLLCFASPAAAGDTCPEGTTQQGNICIPGKPGDIAPQCMTCMPPICRCLHKSDACDAEAGRLICGVARDRCPAAAPAPRLCPLPPHARHRHHT